MKASADKKRKNTEESSESQNEIKSIQGIPVKKIIFWASIALIVIILYFFFVNVKYSIKEELLINMPQRHIEMIATEDIPAELEISSTVETSFFCKAACTEKLINANTFETLHEQNYSFRNFQRIEMREKVYPQISGEGLDIYIYSISCTNIPTSNCPIKESNIEKTAVFNVNRELTPAQERLKEKQEEILSEGYRVLNNGTFLIDYSESFIKSLTHAKSDDLKISVSLSRNNLSAYEKILETSADAFRTYNYSYAQDVIAAINLNEAISQSEADALSAYTAAISRIPQHNNAVNATLTLSNKLYSAENAQKESRQFADLNDDAYLIEESSSLLNYSARKISTKNFNSYSEIYDSAKTGSDFLNSFEETYIEAMQNSTDFAIAKQDLNIMIQDNCYILASINSSINNSANNSSLNLRRNLSSTLCAKYSSTSSFEIPDFSNKSYSHISTSVNEFCSDFSELNFLMQKIEEAQRELEMLSENESSSARSDNARRHLLLLNSNLQRIASRNDSFARASSSALSSYIQDIETENNLSSVNITSYNSSAGKYFESINISTALLLNKITLCEDKSVKPQLNVSYEVFPNITLDAEDAKYNKQKPTLPPRACFNNVCEPFVDNEDKNYPLVIVHGHGFYTKNTKVTPSQVHNELVDALFENKMYLPGGIIKYNDTIIRDSLGGVNAPIVYKASYYPDEIINNESINLFADRLNIIIIKAKAETGKDKVDILAHSMGGLVTRAYLNKYGENDVNIVIIGGTPNYGITTDTVALCKVFGRNLECDEMLAQSEFIENLSREKDYDIPVYTLRGIGCGTFGADGDGVVQSSKVPLPYAKNYAFNGTCSLSGGFHVNLLSPAHNPAIYDKIVEILESHRT